MVSPFSQGGKAFDVDGEGSRLKERTSVVIHPASITTDQASIQTRYRCKMDYDNYFIAIKLIVFNHLSSTNVHV